MTHFIKILCPYADAVMIGEKTFEVRYNDRGYQKGDQIIFRVVDNDSNEVKVHPLNDETYEITYVLHEYGLKEGYCVFGIKKVEVQE